MSSYSPVNKSIIFVLRMKSVISISLIICTLGMIACTGEGGNGQNSQKKGSTFLLNDDTLGADMVFDTLLNNLGRIIEGEQVLCFYKYQNTGDQPLVIHSIKAGCGCTVPEWSEEPLKPGEKNDIKVLFNSSGKRGSQNIRITVSSNSRTPVSSLLLKAEVN